MNSQPQSRWLEHFACQIRLSYEMKIISDGDPYSEFEKFLAEHVHGGRLSFDGIFCVTDSLAYSIIKTLHKLNQKVPEDVQIIGFDGTRHFGYKDYTCSTIVQPVPEMAEMCVDLLLRENISAKPPLVCLPVSYAYGGTTLEWSPEGKAWEVFCRTMEGRWITVPDNISGFFSSCFFTTYICSIFT